MAWACMAASGTGPLVFIDDATADGSSRMNCEVHRAELSAQIQSDHTKPIGRRFTVQMDDDAKLAKKWDILQWPDLSPIEQLFR